MKKGTKRVLCGVLAAALSMPALSGSVFASTPGVSMDEAAYVNLDFYGAVEDISVVKGCSLNGNQEFMDYGQYLSVENMSTHDKAELKDTGVFWSLKKNRGKRFYYSCDIDPANFALPWTFDVSYKLNGVPTRAEDLVGAAGLVEIDLHAIPNKNVTEYFLNNMILTAAFYANMDEVLSFEAEGAQLQSVGIYRGAIFMALPGEEMTYKVRIGTESFESSGVMLMMFPGTLEQLEKIADLKEAKDTVEDSANAIYDSINALCGTLESMDSGLAAMSEGVGGLENVHKNVSEQRTKLEEERATSLNQLTVLADDLDLLVNSLEDAEEMTDVLLEKTETLLKALGSTRKDMDYLTDDLEDMQDDLESVQEDLEAYKKDITTMLTALGQMYKAMAYNLNPSTGASLGEGVTWSQETQERGKFGLLTLQQLETMLSSASGRKGMDNLLETLEETCGTLNDLTESLMKVASASTALNGAIKQYHEDAVEIVSSAKQVAGDGAEAMHGLIQNLTSMNTILKENGEPFDTGLSKTAEGTLEVLDRARDGLKSVSVLRAANTTVKNTIDEQIDKFEDETNMLNMDPNAEKVSLTSPKNPEPVSVQIILRTAEINEDTVAEEIVDLEVEPEDQGIWARICAIFVAIKNKITG